MTQQFASPFLSSKLASPNLHNKLEHVPRPFLCRQAEQLEASSAAFEDTSNSLAGLKLDEDVTVSLTSDSLHFTPAMDPARLLAGSMLNQR